MRFRNAIKENEYNNIIMTHITDVSMTYIMFMTHMTHIVQLILHLLKKSQPTMVLHHGFSLTRLFIKEFRPALFRGRSEICKKVVFSLLKGQVETRLDKI